MRDLTSGAEQVWLGPGLQKSGLLWSGDDQSLIFVGGQAADAARNDVYSVRQGNAPVALTDQPGFKSAPVVDARGATLAYTVAAASPFAARGAGAGGRAGGGGGGGGGRAGAPAMTHGIVSLADKTMRRSPGVDDVGRRLSDRGSRVTPTPTHSMPHPQPRHSPP